jgi:hypothetical protein
MKRLMMIAAFLALLAVSVSADMVDVSMADRWSRVDSQTIIVYQGSKALCLVKILGPFIFQTSEIQFVDDTLEPYSDLIVDGEKQTITEVERLN